MRKVLILGLALVAMIGCGADKACEEHNSRIDAAIKTLDDEWRENRNLKSELRAVITDDNRATIEARLSALDALADALDTEMRELDAQRRECS